ncbi:MAG: hypothetical protein HY881_12545 [Deltaproteobacteria bacterium]|nr:hypothetical protein [Deltaproteobacteria bacterium]
MNKLLMKMIGIESRAALGAPVLLSGLRERLPGMSKTNFEQDVLDLAKSRKYFLTRHFFPESLSDQEKEMMIPAGEGDFFCEINTCLETKLKSSGRGRPPIPELLRREQFGRSIRLPKWIVEWLRAEGNAGKKIEAALIGHYGLTPPE